MFLSMNEDKIRAEKISKLYVVLLRAELKCQLERSIYDFKISSSPDFDFFHGAKHIFLGVSFSVVIEIGFAQGEPGTLQTCIMRSRSISLGSYSIWLQVFGWHRNIF